MVATWGAGAAMGAGASGARPPPSFTEWSEGCTIWSPPPSIEGYARAEAPLGT